RRCARALPDHRRAHLRDPRVPAGHLRPARDTRDTRWAMSAIGVPPDFNLPPEMPPPTVSPLNEGMWRAAAHVRRGVPGLPPVRVATDVGLPCCRKTAA